MEQVNDDNDEKVTNNKSEQMAENDNKKEAAKIVVGLGSQLISAAMSFIAIMGAMVTFILINKTPTPWFYILFAIAFVSFVLSMVFGALGIDFIKQKAQQDEWKTKEEGKQNWFSFQTGAIYLGITLIVFLPFTGEKSKKLEIENASILELLNQTTKLNSRLIEEIKKDSLLQKKILQVENRVNKFDLKKP